MRAVPRKRTYRQSWETNQIPSNPQDSIVSRWDRRIQRCRERQTDHLPRLPWIDDAVVPEPSGSEIRARLFFVAGMHLARTEASLASSSSVPEFRALSRRISVNTPAACSPPITAMRCVGQEKTNRGS